MSAIPIKNIFYMISYAYDLLPEVDPKNFLESDYENTLEMMARVLCASTTRLLRRGLSREYILIEDSVKGVKGKINFSESLAQCLFQNGQSFCSFDEFSYDVPYNQVIYSTLINLLEQKFLRKPTIDLIEDTLQKFPQVTKIKNIQETIQKIRLNQNNFSYKLPLSICAMIDDLTVLDETNGKLYFVDLLKDPKKLHKLFESFVLNFYKREATDFKVDGSKKLFWISKDKLELNQDNLPQMRLDVILKNTDRVIILDTKFYVKTMGNFFGKQTFHANHLYQIMSYLENYKKSYESQIDFKLPEGILLYPTVISEVNSDYKIWDYNLKIRTIDLNHEWTKIHKSLLIILIKGS